MELRSENQVNSESDCFGLSRSQKRTLDTSGIGSRVRSNADTNIYEKGFGSFSVISKHEIQKPHSGKSDAFRVRVARGGSVAYIEKLSSRKNEYYGGGDRASITRFSRSSRNNLLTKLFSLDKDLLDHKDVLMLTLTYDGDTQKNMWISGIEYKRHLKNITLAIQRKYGGFGIWKFELQKRLVGHFHLVWFKTRYISHTWLAERWNEITVGSQDHLKAGVQVERARSWRGVELYGSKVMGYLAKDDSTYSIRDHMKNINMGRVWGICNRQLFAKFVVWMGQAITENMNVGLSRLKRKMHKSWTRAKGEFARYNSFKKGYRTWDRVNNLKLKLFIQNSQFIKMLDWVKSDVLGGIELFTRSNKTKIRHQKFNRLDQWRLDNGYGVNAM